MTQWLQGTEMWNSVIAFFFFLGMKVIKYAIFSLHCFVFIGTSRIWQYNVLLYEMQKRGGAEKCFSIRKGTGIAEIVE